MKSKVFILTLVLSLLLVGCGGSEPSASPASEPAAELTAAPTPEPTPEHTPEPEAKWEIVSQSFKSWPGLVGADAQGIVLVKNTGDLNLYLDSGIFDLEAADGSLLCTTEYVAAYPQVLQPGETGWYYEDSMFNLDEPAEGAVIAPRLPIKEATVECIRFPVSDVKVEFDSTYKRLTLLGRVENTSDAEQPMIYVAAMLYGENDAPLGAIFSIAKDVPAGEKAGFDQMALGIPEDITEEDIVRIETIAWLNQWQFD